MPRDFAGLGSAGDKAGERLLMTFYNFEQPRGIKLDELPLVGLKKEPVSNPFVSTTPILYLPTSQSSKDA
jgi:hypothetical protein